MYFFLRLSLSCSTWKGILPPFILFKPHFRMKQGYHSPSLFFPVPSLFSVLLEDCLSCFPTWHAYSKFFSCLPGYKAKRSQRGWVLDWKDTSNVETLLLCVRVSRNVISKGNYSVIGTSFPRAISNPFTSFENSHFVHLTSWHPGISTLWIIVMVWKTACATALLIKHDTGHESCCGHKLWDCTHLSQQVSSSYHKQQCGVLLWEIYSHLEEPYR